MCVYVICFFRYDFADEAPGFSSPKKDICNVTLTEDTARQFRSAVRGMHFSHTPIYLRSICVYLSQVQYRGPRLSPPLPVLWPFTCKPLYINRRWYFWYSRLGWIQLADVMWICSMTRALRSTSTNHFHRMPWSTPRAINLSTNIICRGMRQASHRKGSGFSNDVEVYCILVKRLSLSLSPGGDYLFCPRYMVMDVTSHHSCLTMRGRVLSILSLDEMYVFVVFYPSCTGIYCNISLGWIVWVLSPSVPKGGVTMMTPRHHTMTLSRGMHH